MTEKKSAKILSTMDPTVDYREAREEDLKALANGALLYFGGSGTDVDRFMAEAKQSILRADMWAILALRGGVLIGVIMGILAPGPDPTAVELHWYVLEKERMATVGDQLRVVFEETAKQKGARSVVMAFKDESRIKTMLRYYKSKGYEFLNMTVRKEI